jgi:beta-galactosidase
VQISEIRNGIFYVDGQPRFLVSGDYPYYRDDPQLWADRLAKMKKGGIQLVTFYIPWRHHTVGFGPKGEQICDFEGTTQPNRNVIRFIQLAQAAGLLVCAKPGPFIHAETNYGGLPDFVNPDRNPKIRPWRNFLALEGEANLSKNTWFPFFGQTLPAPLDPEFLRLTKEYFRAVADRVLKGRFYPAGPIVLLQLLNEGLFSEGRMPYTYSGDYSLRNIRAYRQFLVERYLTIEGYNANHHTAYRSFEEIFPHRIYRSEQSLHPVQVGQPFHPAQVKSIVDWADYGVEYYCRWVNELRTALAEGCHLSIDQLPPLISNWNPAGDFGQGLDVWATRVDVETIRAKCNVHYGFTNWIGAVNYRLSSYLRYSFLCGRANGVNMEENWGFAKIYDRYYKYGFVCSYQTLLAIAAGCTGYNVYTTVGTAHWTKDLDAGGDIPYPSDCPIDERGKLTEKFFHMFSINKMFGEYYGKEFFESNRDVLMAIGLFQPNVQAAAFAGHDIKFWKRMGVKSSPAFGMDFLGHFHAAMRRLKLGYQITNLQWDSLTSPASSGNGDLRQKKFPPMLLFPSTRVLNRDAQEKLLHYVKAGGILVLFGELPIITEDHHTCILLKEALTLSNRPLRPTHMRYRRIEKGWLMFQPRNPFQRNRGPSYYLTGLIVRTLMRLRLKLPGGKAIAGKVLPYSEAVGMVAPALFEKFGADVYNAQLSTDTLRTINKLYRFLQRQGIHRYIDIQLRTIPRYRQKVDIFIYTHPQRDVQYIFLFSLQCPVNLPVSIQYVIPDMDRRIRIKTILVGYTSQLFRIEGGQLTALFYTGVNPINRLACALDLEVNDARIWTDAPTDLCLLSTDKHREIITAHNQAPSTNVLHGWGLDPIPLKRHFFVPVLKK